MKRILSLDGGGLRVFYTIAVLDRVEQIVRKKLGREDAVLADWFDLIAGTSTGAMLGAFLSWGLSIAQIRERYNQAALLMFAKNPNPVAWMMNRYSAEVISDYARKFFSEESGEPAKFGTSRLRTSYLAVMRNASTGAAWPLCNHPALKYNATHLDDCNLEIPLWQIVRASTAAPTFFPPQLIEVGKAKFQFVDGGITPYNNPAAIAALMAIDPCYGIKWPAGKDALYLLSVGTGRSRVRYTERNWWEGTVPIVAQKTIAALLDGAAVQQDMICRVMGRCLYGAPIDSEVGDMVEHALEHDLGPHPKKFTYVRYNVNFDDAEHAAHFAGIDGPAPMDRPDLVPAYEEIGAAYAQSEVRAEHLP